MEVVGIPPSIRMVALDIAHKGVYQVCGDLVYRVIIVSVFGEITLTI